MEDSRLKKRKKTSIRRSLRRKILFGTLVLVAIAGLGALVARPVVHKYRDWKASGLAEEARVAFEARNFNLAADKIGKAKQLSGDNPEVLRILGRLCASNPQWVETANYCFERLVSFGKATEADKLELASIQLTMGNVTGAEKLLSELSPALRASPKALETEARLSAMRGNSSQASQLLRQAVNGEMALPEQKLRSALLDVQNPFTEVQQNAREQLWSLAVAKDQTGLNAIERLCQFPQLRRDEMQRLIDLMKTHPLAGQTHYYLTLSLQIRLDPSQRDEIIQVELVKNNNKPLNELEPFFRWLTDQKQTQTILELLPLQTARQSQPVFPYYLNALATQGSWQKLHDIITKEQSLPLKQGQLNLLLATCRKELLQGDLQISEAIRKAIRLAAMEKDFNIIIQACIFAERCGLRDLALEGYNLLESEPVFREAAMEQTLRIARLQRNGSLMTAILDKIARFYPNKEKSARQACYMHLISGDGLEVAALEAEKWLEKDPLSQESRLVSALGAYRLRNFPLLESSLKEINTLQLEPGQRATLATLLDKAGRTAEAINLAEKIPRQLLLDEEIALFNTSF